MADNRRPVGVNFGKILQGLQGDVQEMKTEYEESCLPINDDNKLLHQFCDRLEFIFSFGLREGSSFLSGRRDLWQYFCKCLANRRNIHDGLKIVKANTELKTSKGRFRCFIRYCLVHQCLGDVVQQCVDNHAVTSQFYQDGSLTIDHQLLPTLLSCLYQLCDVPFDLPPSGHDLDVSWPTFTSPRADYEYLEWCRENSSAAAFVQLGKNLLMCESASSESISTRSQMFLQ